MRWKAQPRQAKFLNCLRDPNGPDEIFYGGSAGGGKTDALLIGCYIGCMEMGTDCLFLRRTFPQLKGKPIPRSKELFDDFAKFNRSDHVWTFPTGRILRFGHCARDGDELQYKSDEYGIIAVDEETDFLESQFVLLTSRNRFVGMKGKPRMLGGSNPGSIGHAWVKARYIDPAAPETVFEAPQSIQEIEMELPPRKRIFIPARLEDNQILMRADPGYLSRLLALPEHMRKAYHGGDWDAFAGQAFSDLERDKHSFKPFDIPRHWLRFGALDWGYAKPFSFGWYAVDECGTAWRYREYYGCVPGEPNTGLRMDAAEVAAEIVKRTKEHLEYVAGDPACWSKGGHSGPSIAESFISAGLPMIKGDNDRLAGLNQCHERLKVDKHGRPGFKVSESCVHFWRTIPTLVHDATKVEDIDTTLEDHIFDEWKYAMMSRPWTAEIPKKPRTVEEAERQLLQDDIDRATSNDEGEDDYDEGY